MPTFGIMAAVTTAASFVVMVDLHQRLLCYLPPFKQQS